MKNLKYLFGVAVMATAMAFVGCNNKPEEPNVNPGGGEENPQPGTETKVPEVAATDGAVTLVIKFDAGVCDGYQVKFVGDYKESADNGGTWNFDAAVAMEAIGDNWYKIVMHASDGAEAISGRPLQLKGGETEWSSDWAHDASKLVRIQGANDDIFADSGFGEVNLSIAAAYQEDAEVIYIECQEWNVSPCVARLGAGTYTFTANLPEALPEGAVLYFTGNFGDGNKAWGESDREMTKVTDVQYTWTGEVPENFAWKVFYVLDGEQTWAEGSNHELITEDDLVGTITWPAPAEPEAE